MSMSMSISVCISMSISIPISIAIHIPISIPISISISILGGVECSGPWGISRSPESTNLSRDNLSREIGRNRGGTWTTVDFRNFIVFFWAETLAH